MPNFVLQFSEKKHDAKLNSRKGGFCLKVPNLLTALFYYSAAVAGVSYHSLLGSRKQKK